LQGNQINIDPVANSAQKNALAVTIDGVTTNYVAPMGEAINKIEAFAQAGANSLIVSSKITLPAELYGGRGSDVLQGGGGNNILVGGSGTELLIGGQGHNILIGGLGTATLQGGRGSNMLVGGSTAYDTDEAALDQIMAEWTEYRVYLQRVDEINGTNAPQNDVYFLNTATVYDAAASDVLTGGQDTDWFFAGNGDTITNRKSREIVS
jgi:Ca2+-binding RTX toxin-like protein